MPIRTAGRASAPPASSCPADPDRYRELSPPGDAHLRVVHAAGRADQPRRGVPRRDRQPRGLRRRRDDRARNQAARAGRGRAGGQRRGGDQQAVRQGRVGPAQARCAGRRPARRARPPSWRRSRSAGCGASAPQSRQALADYGVDHHRPAGGPAGWHPAPAIREPRPRPALRARGIDPAPVVTEAGAEEHRPRADLQPRRRRSRPARGDAARPGRVGRQPAARATTWRPARCSSSCATRASRR